MKKRLVCLILAALLGLSLFACNNDDVPSDSSEGSAEQSDDVSETVSDDGSAAIAAEEAAKIDAMLSGGVPDRTLNRKNELLGLPYKLSRTAGSGDDYADPDGTKLTDGNYAENFARKDTESSKQSPFLPKKTSGKPKHMNQQSITFCLIPAAQVTEVQDKHSTGPY